jgi:hypothetical protein
VAVLAMSGSLHASSGNSAEVRIAISIIAARCPRWPGAAANGQRGKASSRSPVSRVHPSGPAHRRARLASRRGPSAGAAPAA